MVYMGRLGWVVGVVIAWVLGDWGGERGVLSLVYFLFC